MERQIIIREARTAGEVAAFRARRCAMDARGAFPAPAHALPAGTDHPDGARQPGNGAPDRCHCLLFSRDGEDIGCAAAVFPRTQGGTCHITVFCTDPVCRDTGTKAACAQALLQWAKSQGAQYAELAAASQATRRFWETTGFIGNGTDEAGQSLMLLPLTADMPCSVTRLTDPADRQLTRLESRYMREIGESALSPEKQALLSRAIQAGRIAFFLARCGERAIGMCSVAPCFSTFACADTGVFEDFYVEPAFRRKGAARKLAGTAQAWSREQRLSSLTVCCAPCDEPMYQALGFEVRLGHTFAKIF